MENCMRAIRSKHKIFSGKYAAVNLYEISILSVNNKQFNMIKMQVKQL